MRAVTDLLAERLAAATVTHSSRSEADVIDAAAALTLVDERPHGEGGYAQRNALRRAIAAGLAEAGGEASTEYRDLVEAVEAHTADLLTLGIPAATDIPRLARASRSERIRTDAELVVLTPPAILGVLANGPMVCTVALASRAVRHDAWKATTMGVGGTLLSPVVWLTEYVVLARRIGRRRALVLTVAGAAGGRAALAWSERWQRRQRIRWRDAVDSRDPTRLAAAEASRAKLHDRVAALVGDDLVFALSS